MRHKCVSFPAYLSDLELQTPYGPKKNREVQRRAEERRRRQEGVAVPNTLEKSNQCQDLAERARKYERSASNMGEGEGGHLDFLEFSVRLVSFSTSKLNNSTPHCEIDPSN